MVKQNTLKETKQKYINSSIIPNSLIKKTLSVLKSKRFLKIFKYIFELIYYKFKTPETFIYKNKTYNCFYHWYNTTWRGGREVEIPIILGYLKKSKIDILEVGNVLSHYLKTNHNILDKYEKAAKLINEDAATFKTKRKYDLIISISTIEHIGWDEIPRKPEKVLETIKNLESNLKEGGILIFTVPMGYNLYLDKQILQDKIEFLDKTFIQREKGKWKEIKINKNTKFKYGGIPRGHQTICVGIIKK